MDIRSTALVRNAAGAAAMAALLFLGACAATPEHAHVTPPAAPAKSAPESVARSDPLPPTPPPITTPPALSTHPAPTDPPSTPQQTPPPNPPPARPDSTLPPAGPAAATITISGRVADADGNAIQNALIEFKSLPDCPDICAQQQTRTDDTGAYAAQLEPGIYVVFAFFVYPSGGMITLHPEQDPHISGTGDFEVDFVMDAPGQGDDPPRNGAPAGTGGTGGPDISGPAYDFNQDPNNPQYWGPVCASACDPGSGGLPDFHPGGGLTIPDL